jgi:hypothetical protein
LYFVKKYTSENARFSPRLAASSAGSTGPAEAGGLLAAVCALLEPT